MKNNLLLETKNITKRFPGTLALNNINMNIKKGEVHALVGENGAGKSTLTKIITGVYEQNEGDILFEGKKVGKDELRKKISFVPQEINLFPHLTVAENIFVAYNQGKEVGNIINYKDINKKTIDILNKLNLKISPNKIVKDLSTTDKQMIQIARAIINKFEILILDEPTASITQKEAKNIFNLVEKIKKRGKSIIYISHKLEELEGFADRISVLRDGSYIGTWDTEKLTIEEIVKKMAGGRLTKFAGIKQNNNQNEVIFEVENLNGMGINNVSIKLKKGEIVGLAGLVGAGRTEIAKTIFGLLPKRTGKVYINNKEMKVSNPTNCINQGLVYLPEERKELGIFNNLSVKDNIFVSLLNKLIKKLIISTDKKTKIAQEIVDQLNVKTSSLDQNIKYLSGGNQQKVILGRTIKMNPRVVILDEPTRGIDVNAKAEIYEILEKLSQKGVGIIVISSEMEELFKLANRILVVYNGKINGEFDVETCEKNKILSAAMGY